MHIVLQAVAEPSYLKVKAFCFLVEIQTGTNAP